MLLTPVLIAFAAHQAAQDPIAQPTATPTAATLISTMFSRYAAAKSYTGRIKTTQSAKGISVITDTAIAYERPSKIRIDQSQRGPDLKRNTTIVSDGIAVEYTKPEGLLGPSMLRENIKQEGHPAQTVSDLYAFIGASLPDRSMVTDSIVARNDDLAHFRDQLMTFEYKGQTTIANRKVNAIEGSLRTPGTNKKEADFKLYLTNDGEIVRYETVQNFATPAAAPRRGAPPIPGETITVTTVYEVTGTIDQPIPADAFKLPIP